MKNENNRFDKLEAQMGEMMEMTQYLVKNTVTKSEFEELKTDVGGLKTDVSGLKTDVNWLKSNFIKMESKLEEVSKKADKIDDIYTMLDDESSAISENEMEVAAAHHKLERHESWIQFLAKKIHIKLPA